jgi:hypothetical protein
MALHLDLARRCNFFLNAPDWVMREENGRTVVLHLPRVPDDGNFYWIGGTIIVGGIENVPAVFTVSGRDEIQASFWRANDEWFASDDPRLPEALAKERNDLFPFDWRFNVPLERDAYH